MLNLHSRQGPTHATCALKLSRQFRTCPQMSEMRAWELQCKPAGLLSHEHDLFFSNEASSLPGAEAARRCLLQQALHALRVQLEAYRPRGLASMRFASSVQSRHAPSSVCVCAGGQTESLQDRLLDQYVQAPLNAHRNQFSQLLLVCNDPASSARWLQCHKSCCTAAAPPTRFGTHHPRGLIAAALSAYAHS